MTPEQINLASIGVNLALCSALIKSMYVLAKIAISLESRIKAIETDNAWLKQSVKEFTLYKKH